ncbi:ECF-type sigma factor [Thalassoglobus polymorphus]|uniref:RNA polymerase sigma factor SigL n=1 Tax=Thalassoglobus polymorphus TaxID=2527994 RepID=A0A517QLH0_9PLAN|nr:ECF-type sigma factor [Thalassoglobus polymorphus]QDT32387.1 RNA polymerase sigma factor SigL [Thalassoglobus polymorphus]
MPESPEPAWQQSLYDQLHVMCQKALSREQPGHSLQPTLLLNDAYLKLIEQRNLNFEDRSQVLAAGAVAIRRLLIDYARSRKALSRGGSAGRGISLNISVADSANTIGLLELDDVLKRLGEENQRQAKVVELKYFGGLTVAEIAKELDVSLGTVNNEWVTAKAWLYRELSSD